MRAQPVTPADQLATPADQPATPVTPPAPQAGQLAPYADQLTTPAADAGFCTAEARLQKGLALSYSYINRRERTEAELIAHLERKGIEAGIAADCLRELTDLGYVDDRRYALMFVHDKRELEGWGSERIRRGLAERGVDATAIESALAEHEAEWSAGETELDRAVALLARRFPEPPRERRDRDRALGALMRKGFDSELALDALTAYVRGR